VSSFAETLRLTIFCFTGETAPIGVPMPDRSSPTAAKPSVVFPASSPTARCTMLVLPVMPSASPSSRYLPNSRNTFDGDAMPKTLLTLAMICPHHSPTELSSDWMPCQMPSARPLIRSIPADSMSGIPSRIAPAISGMADVMAETTAGITCGSA